jgi:CMP/dCMP kinase
MTRGIIIAIDGPAASGKSTLGQNLAEALGFRFFDTGILYRAITLAVLQAGIDPGDEEGAVHLAQQSEIDILPSRHADGRAADVLLNGQDVTWEIRHPLVDANVSQISAYPGVRQALSALQRRIGLQGDVVMAGRDIGTVVLPEADLKIFLNASVEERARRRYEEQLERRGLASEDEILDAMKRRDQIDSTRELAPLRPADDAVIINSEGRTSDMVLAEVLALAHRLLDQQL